MMTEALIRELIEAIKGAGGAGAAAVGQSAINAVMCVKNEATGEIAPLTIDKEDGGIKMTAVSVAATSLAATIASACNFTGEIQLGGVTLFVQDATPTANAADDLWYETDTNLLWFWNGTYWLSTQLHTMEFSAIDDNTENAIYYQPGDWGSGIDHDLYFESFAVRGKVAATNDGTDNWDFSIRRHGTGSTTISTFSSAAWGEGVWASDKNDLTTYYDVSGGEAELLYFQADKNNAPGNYWVGLRASYRWVHL